jgi:MFS family permease
MSLLLGLLVYNTVDTVSQKPLNGSKISDLDFVAVALFALSIAPLLVGLSLAGSVYEWTNWRTIVPITFGCVFLLIFVGRELLPNMIWFNARKERIRFKPLLDLKAFRSPRGITIFMGAMILGMLVGFPPEQQKLT